MNNKSSEFPVPVVRLIIPDSKGRVLALKRQNSEYAEGKWCLPGGKIDYGDTIAKTIAKELHEETSLTCTSYDFLFYQESLPIKPGGMHCINFYFRCSATGNIILNEENSEYAWIGPDDINKFEIVFRNDLALKRYYEEL